MVREVERHGVKGVGTLLWMESPKDTSQLLFLVNRLGDRVSFTSYLQVTLKRREKSLTENWRKGDYKKKKRERSNH